MDPDPPPDPPDPGGGNVNFAPQIVSRKRQGEEASSNQDIVKKTIIDPSTATPSIQNVWIHPSMSEAPKSYISTDKGPFIVYVSRESPDPSAGTAIRAIKFGQFLHTNKITDIVNDGVKNVGRNKISVQFTSAEAANKFLVNPVLSLCKYVCVIPTFNITRMGIVKGVPVEWSLEEFVGSLIFPTACGEVIKVRRMNRKNVSEGVVTWVPTQTVVITLRGQQLPERVFSYKSVLNVELYKYPTIQCLNCCRFGHVKSQCRSKPRCYRCSQSHTGDACDTLQENATCIHCTSKHFATDKGCPEYVRQQNIKAIMSQECISYMEASSRFPSVQRSYADVAKEMFSPPVFMNSQPQQSRSPVTPTKSYRKTVFQAPRPRSPMAKGYDRQAHQSIISNCSSSLPNGCALNQGSDSPAESTKDLLIALTDTLVSIISTADELPLPSNVAQNLLKIFKILHNGPTILPTVE